MCRLEPASLLRVGTRGAMQLRLCLYDLPVFVLLGASPTTNPVSLMPTPRLSTENRTSLWAICTCSVLGTWSVLLLRLLLRLRPQEYDYYLAACVRRALQQLLYDYYLAACVRRALQQLLLVVETNVQ